MTTQEEQFKDAQRQEGERDARHRANRDFAIVGEPFSVGILSPAEQMVFPDSSKAVANWNQPAQLAKTRAQFSPHFALMDKQQEERKLLDAEEWRNGGES